MRAGHYQVDILLYEENRKPLLPIEPGDDHADLLDDAWLDAVGRLIEYEKARGTNQHAPYRQYLLLTAAQHPCPNVAALGKEWEVAICPVQRGDTDANPNPSPEREVLLDGQAHEHVTPLGNVAYAKPGAEVGWHSGNILALEFNPAGTDRNLASNCPDERGLADTVSADERHHLPGINFEANAPVDRNRPVSDINRVKLQHDCHCGSGWSSPDALSGVIFFRPQNGPAGYSIKMGSAAVFLQVDADVGRTEGRGQERPVPSGAGLFTYPPQLQRGKCKSRWK